MKKVKKYGLILSSILLGLLACQKGIEMSSENDTKFKEYRSWLKTSDGIFSSEKIALQNQSGENISGKLSWSLATKSKNKNGEEIVIAPFTFTQSVYKNKKVYNDVSVGELPSIYSLLIKKDKNGLFEGRLRARSFIEDAAKGKRIINILYKLSGEVSFEFIREGDGKDYVLHEESINAGARTTSCDVTSTTSRYVECTGGMDNTVCTYRSRTTHRYHCTYNGEAMPEEVQNFQPDEGGGGGWYEYEESETVYANQKIIDSLQGYPCAQDVLKELPNIDSVVNNILQDVFGVNEDINITFRPGIGMPIEDDGETQCGGSASFFKCNVKLNPHVLNNSSEDYMVATIIHEALHAYIMYKRTELGENSVAFQTLFPIYSNYIGNDPQHNVMSNQYINMMSNVIRGFNPSISNENAIKLSWQGLSMTTLWGSQDTTAINAFNVIAKTPSINDYTSYNLKKCP